MPSATTGGGEARRGNLRDEPLPGLLYNTFRHRVSGVIRIQATGGAAEVFLHQGYPGAVELPGAVDRLGSVLVASGALDPATYRKSLTAALPPGVHYGQLLVQEGMITREQLLAALRLQTRRRLHRLFFVDGGDWAVETRMHERGLESGEWIRIEPRRAILQGVRSAWNEARFGETMRGLGDEPLRVTPVTTLAASYGMKDEEARVVKLLQERPRSLEELDQQLGAATVHPVVYTLAVTEGLEGRPALGGRAAPTPSKSGSEGAKPAATSSSSLRRKQATPTGTDPELLALAVTRKVAVVDSEDLFQVLALPRTASKAEVKAAYLEAAKLYHPDRLAAVGLHSLRADAERIFRRVSEAHATLTDDARRAAYLERVDDVTPMAMADGQRIIAAEMSFREGEVAFKRRDFVKAISSLERAVEMNPSEGEAVALLAWTRFSAGRAQLESVRPELEQAVALSPRCGRAHYYLGMAYKQLGDEVRAIASFRKAVDLDERLVEAQGELRVLVIRGSKRSDSKSLIDRFRKK
jgi:tetratricopeptide (TPR) repeat protein